ncbi:unnamed protein product [Paramecium octaurelia]|uniref:Protein kinase domain-containing protein n=1 Tax=Paramecium octaurelia TaxID=43137 RepID=A0A8S1YFG5_PAROT|nr:unnamed protein product [Paramecium octaurelia]
MDPKSLIDDLNDILLSEYYCFIEILGRGSFGIVIAAYSSNLDKIVAIKVTPYFEQEIESCLLQECFHPNIVKLYRVLKANNYIYLIMEKLTGQTLDMILRERNIEEIEVRNIMQQVLNALVFIHRKGIIHRDLKPENIFICANNLVKLIDLGLGYQIVCRGIIGQQVGTPFYIAPEVINGGEQTQAIDIFSLGIIYYMMMCNNKHPIWQDGVTKKEYYKIISQDFSITYPYHLSEMAQDFVRNTVCHNAFDRMTAEQCLEHPWMLGEQSKSHPITNREIKLRYSFCQKFLIIIKALNVIKYMRDRCQEEMYYLKTQESDEINEIILNHQIPMTSRVQTETNINLNNHRIQNLKKSFTLTKTTSHQDFTTMKNRQLNKYNAPNRYQTQLDLHLSIPKVNSQKKIHVHLPSISPQQTKQSIFSFKQS